jgi:BirA family transcriptional regulator, biotin operon repressor / biotin---[acetyl-CoA-carboxylase] ligase
MVTAVLDPAARSRLATATRFADVRFVESVGSTNDQVAALARAGAAEGLVVVADHQTAGRGRRGRQWSAPSGSSLLVSILLRPALPANRLHLVGAVASLSATDACRQVAGVEARLKWPNDLVVEGRKLGGVLVEADLAGGRARAAVAGIGLNVWWPEGLPPELAGEAVTLGQLTGQEVARPALLVALLRSLEARYALLESPAGQDAALADYRRCCDTLGRRVRVVQAGEGLESFTGTAVDVDAEGRLVVVADDGQTRAVTVADVVHLRRPEGA